MKRYAIACMATWLALAAGTPSAAAQASSPAARQQQRPSATLRLGPRLLEYRIECTNPDSCRVQCFQHGVKVFDHAGIKKNDRLHLLASTGAEDEIIPRWIEIRPANGKPAHSILLSSDTACDLQSLTILPNPQP